MVFESLIADLLNKYLGDYVENLDRSQLKIGIWGGDVVLKNLALKECALDDLQLPVKTVNGFLGKLVLKIPWKNLYSAPVEANIEDLYLLVAPNTEFKYDPEKEERWKQEAKQAQILKVEEAKKTERDKDKPKADDTFTEKLATQIVRNVQISIKNIHIRYEDRVHHLGKPFALGITLSKLLVTTTDDCWRPQISSSLTSMIYKILEIEGLSVYWNSKNELSLLNSSSNLMVDSLKQGIATKDKSVDTFNYLLGPINATAKLRLNTKPEIDGSNFIEPRVLLNLDLQKLQIQISKNQYQDLMVLLDSLDTMARGAPYRKYRPLVHSYKGHYKIWWRFAYKCILEEEVRRRHRNWSWNNILEHRQACREYAKSYMEKLSTPNSSKQVLDSCQLYENFLDVLNIVLIRQKIEMEVIKKESIDNVTSKKPSGWFSGWWGSSKKEEESTENVTLKQQFEEAMTQEEKSKLYKAIGYQENSAPAQYPVEFVAIDLNFCLTSLECTVLDSNTVLLGSINMVTARFQQRPAANAVKLNVTMEHFLITGMKQGEVLPKLVQTEFDKDVVQAAEGPLLDIVVETNPLDQSCDQRVHVTSRPLYLTYDALTINKVIDVFTVEESPLISHIQYAATERLTNLKNKSSLGLQYALEKQSILDLKVNLQGFFGVLPQGGHYLGYLSDQAIVVANFGQLLVNSRPRHKSKINVRQLYNQGSTDADIKELVLKEGFDRFDVELKAVQVQLVLPGEMWKIHLDKGSERCILQPINLEVHLAKNLLLNDYDDEKLNVNVVLPAIDLQLSEKRILSMIALLTTIPLPPSKQSQPRPTKYQMYGSHSSLNKLIEMTKTSGDNKRKCKKRDKKKGKKSDKNEERTDYDRQLHSIQDPRKTIDSDLKFTRDESVDEANERNLQEIDGQENVTKQFTDLVVAFQLKEFSVKLFREAEDGKQTPLMALCVYGLETNFVKRDHDLKVTARLGGLALNQNFGHNKIHVINTPVAEEGKQEDLFVVEYIMATWDSPYHDHTTITSMQLLDINFSRLDVLVHQEAMLDVIQWITKVYGVFLEITKAMRESQDHIFDSVPEIQENPYKLKPSLLAIPEENSSGVLQKKSHIQEVDSGQEEVEFKLKAFLGEITITIQNRVRPVAVISVNGGKALMKNNHTGNIINLCLKNMEIIDLNENTIHNKVVSNVEIEDALQMHLYLYKKDVVNIDDANMYLKVQIARFQVVFLYYFFNTVLEFSNQFCATPDVIKEASAAAAEVAKVNMQQKYIEAYRIKLNVRLKAPIILIPANSNSQQALLLDFGVLTLKNKISEMDCETQEVNKLPIIDTLDVGLCNFKVSRVTLTPNMEVDTESLILQPASFNVAITRNLSDWFKDIPDLDVSGKIEAFHVVLSEQDYIQVMTVVYQNMGEVPAASQNKPRGQITEKDSETIASPTKTKESRLAHSFKGCETKIGGQNIGFKCSFELSHLVVELVNSKLKEPNVEHGKESGGVCLLRSSHILARFTLLELAASGFIRQDSSMFFHATLKDCILDDTRPEVQHHICRYMQCLPRPNTTDESHWMIEFSFKREQDQTDVSFKVVSFLLILNLEHLLMITELFMSAQEELARQSCIQIVRAHEEAAREELPAVKAQPQLEAEPGTSSDEEDADLTKTMNIELIVEKPDIILVEYLTPNSNAIILNTRIDVKIKMYGPFLNVTGSIGNLQVFSCCFDPSRRLDTKVEILRPLSISLLCTNPSGQGLHAELTTTNLRIKVTPGTIELLNSIFTKLTTKKESTENQNNLEEDYLHLWDSKHFNSEDYWFLKTAKGQEAVDVLISKEGKQEKDEICMIRVPSLVITLEAGVGKQTLPMLLLESSLQAQAHNWSSLATVDGTATLQMSYYNSRLALWEPLIEPVEIAKPGGGRFFAPWELSVQIEKNEPGQLEDTDFTDIKPAMVMNINSKDTLQVTVTKTCLEVLKNLGTAFNNAIFNPDAKSASELAPYVVHNYLGMDVCLSLTEDTFMVVLPNGKNDPRREVLLMPGVKVNLALTTEEDVRSMVGQISSVYEKFLRFKFQISDKDFDLEIPVTRADKRFFPLQHRGFNNDLWGVVSDVKVLNGSTVITLRSVVKVINHFQFPVKVYFMTKRGNELELVDEVEPRHELDLPLHAVYTPTNELFFSITGYSVSNAPFVWKDLQQNLSITKVLQCKPKPVDIENKEPFFIQAVGEMEQIYHELGSYHTMSSNSYNINLRPTVILRNFLPLDITIFIQGRVDGCELKPGKSMQIPTADPGHSSLIIKIAQYLNKDWSCNHEIPADPPEFSVWSFQNYGGPENSRTVMDLGMHCTNDSGSLKLSLYCPFWMINKTGLMLSYRKSSKPEPDEECSTDPEIRYDTNVNYHPPNFKGPIMFSFRAKSFYGKKKSSIRVNKGEWSDKFSLDVAGSSGVVNCKAGDLVYKIGVNVQLTYNTLTKQVTFAPFYVLINNCPFTVEVSEVSGRKEDWIQVDPEAVSPFWPLEKEVEGKTLELRLRIAGTPQTTVPFPYNRTINCLLKLENQYGAVSVDVHITEGVAYITFLRYSTGMAPSLLINHSDLPISVMEKNGHHGSILEAGKEMLFNWSSTKDNQILIWGDDGSSDLKKDDVGVFTLDKNNLLMWVSFLNGMQRVLLFTSNEGIARGSEFGQFDIPQYELQVFMHGFGLSLVDNLAKLDILYLGISSSGVIWETRKVGSRKYKSIQSRDIAKIEEAYMRYMQELAVGKNPISICAIGDNIVVDFAKNELLRPQARELRRTYNQGLWAKYQSSEKQVQLHVKVNRLQMDNQTFDCVFPVVFAPVPPPKSVSSENVSKPFAELSLVQRVNPHSNVKQFKYCKLLIQEFHIKVDTGFINALVKMFEGSAATDDEQEELFSKDLTVVDASLVGHVTFLSSQDLKNFYDFLHFSPLKIHVSFSLSGGGPAQSLPPVLNVVMQSLGVTLTEIQDVILKLSYFERTHIFLSFKQLMSEAQMHYQGQLIKQFLVLVLGLDVLGNPFGLVVGITEGVQDLFYEPFQGAVQGPGEFCEGLVLGVRSLVGHTVGGAAGAVSRITGVVGKGVAALTFDEDYQRKRRELLNARPTSMPQGLAQSGKGLVMGVVEGVGGVFSKPISGAREEGVEGFIKGMGKGMVGLVTRPTSGIIDFASGSLSAVKRATELGEEVTRLRDPRCFKADNYVRPYSKMESEGNRIIKELEKGKYYTTDEYVYHTAIGSGKCRDVLLLTDKRLLLLSRNDIFGGNQVEFTYTWGEFVTTPTVVAKGVEIRTSGGKKKLFRSNEQARVIIIEGEALKNYVVEKIKKLMFPRSTSSTLSRQSTLS